MAIEFGGAYKEWQIAVVHLHEGTVQGSTQVFTANLVPNTFQAFLGELRLVFVWYTGSHDVETSSRQGCQA